MRVKEFSHFVPVRGRQTHKLHQTEQIRSLNRKALEVKGPSKFNPITVTIKVLTVRLGLSPLTKNDTTVKVTVP